MNIFKTTEQKKDEARAKIEALALAAEPGVIAQRESFLKEAREAHALDIAGFHFSAVRWGDFLNVSTARLANKPRGDWDKQPISFSTAVNIPATTQIHLVTGHAPDEDGSITYGAIMEMLRANGDVEYRTSPYAITDKQHRFVVTPNLPYINLSRQLSCTAVVVSNNSGGSFYSLSGGFESSLQPKLTTSFPRDAEDDQIVFVGAGLTIYVPAGLGVGVHEQILKATGRNTIDETSGGGKT